MLEKMPAIIGKAMKGLRPGLEATVAHTAFADRPQTIAVESTAFGHEAALPRACTQDGSKTSPPLAWRNAPTGTAETVLIVEDADSPTPEPLVHAIVYGLPPEGSIEAGAFGTSGAGFGETSMGKEAWLPPDPPTGHGPHRYVFQLLALGRPSGLQGRPGRSETIKALQGKVSAKGLLIGTYERS